MPTELNAADLASRGICPSKVDCAGMWFNGPPFLTCNELSWPEQPKWSTAAKEEDAELRKVKISSNVVLPGSLHQLVHRYSGFTSLQKSVAWLRRFVLYVKWKKKPSLYPFVTGPLTLPELENSTTAIIQFAQREEFSDCPKVLPSYSKLSEVKPISDQLSKEYPCLWRLQTLNPHVVQDTLRVGGRLQNSPLSESAKHRFCFQISIT